MTNVIINLEQTESWKNITVHYTWILNISVTCVVTWRQWRVLSPCISSPFMKGRHFNAGIVIKKGSLTSHQQSIHEGKKYPCRECDYKATTNSNITTHQQSIHEGKKFLCLECDFKATTKSSLTKHQQSIHEGKKYQCSDCSYQATEKGSLTKHQQSIHEGKKYQCIICSC